MSPTDKIDNLIKQLKTPASGELDARIDVLLEQSTYSVRPMNIWSRIMKSNVTKSAAAAIIIIGAFIFLTQSNGTSKVFANAMEHIAAAQTARFDLTIEFDEQQPQTSSFLYDAKGYIRQNMANGTVNFVDYNTDKVHSMVPDANTVFIRNVNHLDFLHTTLYDVFINLEDLIQQAIEIGYGDVEDLGTRKIDGKTAYGWRIETSPESSELFQYTEGTLTVWAEAETDMPLMFIWHHAKVDLTATVSSIDLNVVFDPEEMSITLPDDYTVQDETLHGTNPTSESEEIDRQARDTLEIAIQLGADIPEDKRAIVLRMLSLKEDDLIKGLATYLEFSGGTYPPTLNFNEQFVKNLDALLKRVYKEHNLDKKQSESKTFDISFAAFFYDKLTREKKEPAYYGDTMTVNDSDKVLVRWKISKSRYRVIFADLTRETVTADELSELESLISD